MRALRDRLTYANVMSTLAFFVAVGGTTAWAVDGPNPGQNTIGSEDIIGNEVKSDDIGNGRIFNLDVADEILTGQKLKDGTVTGSDVDESTLNLDSLTEESENALFNHCDPDDAISQVCATTTLNLPRSSRLFVSATGSWAVDGFSGGNTNQAFGRCSIRVDTVAQSDAFVDMGESLVGTGPVAFPSGFALSDLTAVLSPGPHTVDLHCTENDRDVFWQNTKLVAFSIGD